MANPVNAKKLLLSKWTSVHPYNKEKHHLVVKVIYNKDLPTIPQTIIMEAIINHRQWTMDWQELIDSDRWQPGWQ
ncbi:MAG: hypothetical protein B7Z60_09310 [Ferrovum sp. 37-45-19]|jgi:tryptophan-rich hypothetical protein|uniref:TIGR02450 family Trp-rich protein n=1 Tax=Ferrovum sp. JA12 TaxID=1356299 RepID=UPI0007039149|nr:TIGR02450 family Trp-rich protein [Ferrovum sp. JA12]OYV78676.1 MAG: hypothetical protein B7Z65_09290 [Ferrovum sp. 21-44-67]OYV93247.1 MAG: hypothetical protein B7Z60_09310 [Ferrovum sp. 37-45-19]OZB33206.1 MAG: hypothetical protein B7X47_04965 [Ferrovum sp. 34-44-207]HQT82362.1 TIGR02450 family Trp-rich protein [Ferrovaceae bacterium]KRH79921.1 hypothetical protein FERRO_09980 [Ferrovum sp. JA12]